MAVKLPLVITNGEIEQLQAGDSIENAEFLIQKTFTSTVIAGEPVYIDSATSVEKAQANAAGTSDVFGMAPSAVTAAATGSVQLEGIMTLTTGEWDALAGTTGGLDFGVKYWLDPTTAGRITSTAPTTIGQYVTELGEGVSTTELNVRVRRRILL